MSAEPHPRALHPWAVAAPHLPETLVSPRARTALDPLLTGWPVDAMGALELRLAPGSSPGVPGMAPSDAEPDRVDASIRLDRPEQAEALLASVPRSAGPSSGPPPTRQLLEGWSSREPPTSAAPLAPIEALWLEFDLPAAGSEDREPRGGAGPVVCARPVVCAGPLVCARLRRPWQRQAADPARRRELIEHLAPALLGRPLPPDAGELLEQGLTALPPCARLLYLFGLDARGQPGLRLEAAFDPDPRAEPVTRWPALLETAGAYLGRVRAPGAAAVLSALEALAGAAPPPDGVHLSLDLLIDPKKDDAGPTAWLSPRTGLELSYRHRFQGRETGSGPGSGSGPGPWSQLFDALPRTGARVCPAKVAALAGWPGTSTFWTEPARWPVAALGLRGSIVRRLSHGKLVCRPGRPPVAKVYLLWQWKVPGRP